MNKKTNMLRWFRRDPKFLTERRQFLSEAVADYPLYQPPHRQGPNYLRRVQNQKEDEHIRLFHEFMARGEENFQFFLEQRSARLAALYAFLDKFSVKASLDDTGLSSVSAWLPGNGCALIGDPRNEAIVQAFYQMQTPWTQSLRGFNVVFDFGIFLGEALIARQPRLRWKLRLGLSEKGESASTGCSLEGFLMMGQGTHLDPPQRIFGECWNEVNMLSSRQPRFMNSNLLVGIVHDFSTR
jgi:hypothetical protein